MIALVSIVAAILLIGALSYLDNPEEELPLQEEQMVVRVVGQVFFDDPNYGAIGKLDSYDFRSGAGVEIMVFLENQHSPGVTSRVFKGFYEPDGNGVYQFWLEPGRYFLAIEKAMPIAAAYPGISFVPNSFITFDNTDDLVFGPIVFIYDYKDYASYALG